MWQHGGVVKSVAYQDAAFLMVHQEREGHVESNPQPTPL